MSLTIATANRNKSFVNSLGLNMTTDARDTLTGLIAFIASESADANMIPVKVISDGERGAVMEWSDEETTLRARAYSCGGNVLSVVENGSTGQKDLLTVEFLTRLDGMHQLPLSFN